MDDSYKLPKRCHIMGKGRIVNLLQRSAVIQGTFTAIEIFPFETFRKPNLNLREIFQLSDDVVYKAERCFEPGPLFRKYIATYVKRLSDCVVGEAVIIDLSLNFGRALFNRQKLFFNAIAFGDRQIHKYYASIRDCRKFFRAGDQISFIAVRDVESPLPYCLHFDFIPKSNASGRKTGIVVEFEPPNVTSGVCDGWTARLWVKNLGFVSLAPRLLHEKLKDVRLVLNLGNRVTFSYQEASFHIEHLSDVHLDDSVSQCRFKKWLIDSRRNKLDNSSKKAACSESGKSDNNLNDLDTVSTVCDDFFDMELDALNQELTHLNSHPAQNSLNQIDIKSDSSLNVGSDSEPRGTSESKKEEMSDSIRQRFLDGPSSMADDLTSAASVSKKLADVVPPPTAREADETLGNAPLFLGRGRCHRIRMQLRRSPLPPSPGRKPVASVADSSLPSSSVLRGHATSQNFRRAAESTNRPFLVQSALVVSAESNSSSADATVAAKPDTNEVGTQTDVLSERTLIDEIMNDAKVFECIASSNPSLLRKLYASHRK